MFAALMALVGDAVEEERLDLEDPGLLLAQHGLGSIPLGGGRTDELARLRLASGSGAFPARYLFSRQTCGGEEIRDAETPGSVLI
jgi:hypothetical protein